MADEANVWSSPGILRELLFIGLGVIGTMFMRGIRSEERNKQQDREVLAINAHLLEFKALVEKLAGSVAVMDKQIQLISVTLTGVDGHNGLRSEVRSMAQDVRTLEHRLVRLEALVNERNEEG